MAYQITKVQVVSPGTHEQHISEVMLSDGTRETREQVHRYIKEGHQYYFTIGGFSRARVEAVTSSIGTKYIRTHPDDSKLNNLLSLPRY